MTTDLLENLVDEAGKLVDKIPETVAARAGMLAADTIGVMLAGGDSTQARNLVTGDAVTGSWRRPQPDPEPAGTLLTAGGGYADPERAAFLNATAACALELDEGVRPTGHPSAHVLPAALAAAEATGASWSSMIRGYVAGYEVAAGLFGAFRFRGDLHPHGHLGGVGAAVAVAILTGADPLVAARTAAALSLLTTWSSCREGADARNTWTGHGAATGLLAHRLAQAGYREPSSALASAFDGLVADRIPATSESPRVLGGYLKLYSACALTHGAIEAAASLAPLSPDEVDSVDIRVGANCLRIAGQAADTPLGRRFSLPYAVAIALRHGDALPRRFRTADPVSFALAERAHVREDLAATGAWPYRAPASIEVRLTGGKTRTASCREPQGHPGAPVSTQRVRRKFHTLTGLDRLSWDRLSDPHSDRSVRETLAGIASS